jgi:hypothetical protein
VHQLQRFVDAGVLGDGDGTLGHSISYEHS